MDQLLPFSLRKLGNSWLTSPATHLSFLDQFQVESISTEIKSCNVLVANLYQYMWNFFGDCSGFQASEIMASSHGFQSSFLWLSDLHRGHKSVTKSDSDSPVLIYIYNLCLFFILSDTGNTITYFCSLLLRFLRFLFWWNNLHSFTTSRS